MMTRVIYCVIYCVTVIVLDKFRGGREACPDDNLQGILSIHLKLGKYIHSIKIWKSLDFGIDWLRNGRVIND